MELQTISLSLSISSMPNDDIICSVPFNRRSENKSRDLPEEWSPRCRSNCCMLPAADFNRGVDDLLPLRESRDRSRANER